MSETPPVAPSPQLPTQQANAFTLALNANEILLAVGQTRVSVRPSPNGPQVEAGPEWLACLSISPTAAEQLVEMLKKTVEIYKAQFGEIPKDPQFKINQGNQPQAAPHRN
jgi:hypothetical protein